MEGPTHEVDANRAVHGRPIQAAPAVQQLTYGQGDGRQPAPDYPPEAIAARHQGNVRVRFSVGEDGRVLTAQVVGPCPWPMLNQSALRTVRERWRFRAGPPRLYEVTIAFQIKQ
ncbi:MAG: energy transducer TonB [Chthoniobacter sp.]|nr:energy transducer TonB [Chthoniobacter sp.]